MKRLMVCCDGTYIDALHELEPNRYTNVYRMYQCLRKTDTRDPNRPVSQISMYVRGIGTASEVVAGTLDAALGTGVLEEVREVYAFLAKNWELGDEIWLFGFSRGAYIAKLTATLISEMGIMDDLTEFPRLMNTLEHLSSGVRSSSDRNVEMLRWTAQLEKARQQKKQLKQLTGSECTVTGLCLFDLVTSEGLPEILRSARTRNHSVVNDLLGLPQHILPLSVRNCFHAMALDENRPDYQVIVLEQSLNAPPQQHLEQVWFSGSHSDIGGGWNQYDLSTLTVWWLVDHLAPHLDLDLPRLMSLTLNDEMTAPYGELKPHNPRTSIFKAQRPFWRPVPLEPAPVNSEDVTNQRYHFSVACHHEGNVRSDVAEAIRAHPMLVAELGPFEQHFRMAWTAKAQDLHKVGTYRPDGLLRHVRIKLADAGNTFLPHS